jgi:hypothetical protein
MMLVCTVGGTSVLAKTSTRTVTIAESPSEATIPVKKEPEPNEKLRAAVNKLLADTKAGKEKLAPQPQIQPAKSNGLSKGKKIALGVGIAVTVVAVIVIVHEIRTFPNFNFKGIAIH